MNVSLLASFAKFEGKYRQRVMSVRSCTLAGLLWLDCHMNSRTSSFIFKETYDVDVTSQFQKQDIFALR